jgi:dUTP pyrophosphatase
MERNLKILIDDKDLKDKYENHSTYNLGDSGLDLFVMQDLVIPENCRSFEINLGIKCEALENDSNVSYFLYMRSSTGSKTPLRLCNSVGIIDAGYRGFIKAYVDNISEEQFIINKGDRLFQICWRDLSPFDFVVVDKLSSSERGMSGFGSTN